jgi:hypothetical protein
MANSDAMKGIRYGGIAAAGILGIYLLFKTIKKARDPKVQSAVITAIEHPAALSSILQGKRYDTRRKVQGDSSDSDNDRSTQGGTRKRKNRKGKTKKH